MREMEAVATASVAPAEALQWLRALLRDVDGSAVEDVAETVYETLRSVVWQHVSGRTGGDEPRAWADVVLRIRQSLRHKGSPVAERLTALYDLLDQTVRFEAHSAVRGATTGDNVKAILAFLHGEDGETPRAAIAKATGIRDSNLSRILSNMCADGLVRRTSHGREVRVSLAPEGRKRLGDAGAGRTGLTGDVLVSGSAARSVVRELWSSAGCALAVADREGMLIACDSGFASLFGVTETSLEGLTQEQVRARFEDCGPELGEGALEGRSADGRTFRMTVHSTTHGSLWMGVDVTPYRDALSASQARERELAREKRRRNDERTVSRDAASGRWARDVLADHGPSFVSAITAINGYAELMRTEAFGPVHNHRYIEYASEIASRSDRLRNFLGDVVKVAGVEDHGSDARGSIVPRLLIEDAMSRVTGRMRDLDVFISFAGSPPPTVHANVGAARAMIFQMVNGTVAGAPAGTVVVIGSYVMDDNLVIEAKVDRGFRSVWRRVDFETVCRGLADTYGGRFDVADGSRKGLVTKLALPLGKPVGGTRG